MKKFWLVPVVGALIAMPVFAGLSGKSKAADPATVGSFALKVAVALGLEPGSENEAVASLRAAGASVNENPGARLTEGVAARVLVDLGLKVAPPKNPSKPVSASLASALATQVALTTSAKVASKGASAPPPPVSCLTSKNHGQCVSCCVHSGFKGNFCSKYCKANQPPPPSGSQP